MKHAGESHEARKALFQRGIKYGHLTVDEIDRSLPAGSLSAAERWLLFYSLRAAGVEISGERGQEEQPRSRGDADGPDAPGPDV